VAGEVFITHQQTQCNGAAETFLAAWRSSKCRWGGLLCLAGVGSPVGLADVSCCILQYLSAVQCRQLGVFRHPATGAGAASMGEPLVLSSLESH
jgi:hypothetical protein